MVHSNIIFYLLQDVSMPGCNIARYIHIATDSPLHANEHLCQVVLWSVFECSMLLHLQEACPSCV